MPDNDPLNIEIGGDIRSYESALDSLPELATAAGQAVSDALSSSTGGSDALTASVDAAAASMGALAPAAAAVSDAFRNYQSALADSASGMQTEEQATERVTAATVQLQQAIQAYNSSASETTDTQKRIADSSEQAASGIDRINESIQHAKEVAEAFLAVAFVEKLTDMALEAVHAYGEQEQLAKSLTLMSGSASEAAKQMDNIDQMSIKLGLDQSKLEASARALSVAFGAGDGLSAVLKASADVAAVTGTSMDSVGASLERVQQTGQVSQRQLLALGLSWQDLANSMGVSIDQAQKLLKKGGQEAAQDVDDLLKAIQGKFGNAAAEQAKGVIGQFTSLKSQLEVLTEDLGGALAPEVSKIVAFFSDDIVPAIKSAIEAFKALPEPVKEFIVVGGALAAVLIPAAAGLAALGFALQGIGVLASAFGINLATATAKAEALAVAEGQVAVSTNAVSASMTTAATAATTLATAETSAAVQLGLFADQTSAAMTQMEMFTVAELEATVATDTMAASSLTLGQRFTAFRSTLQEASNSLGIFGNVLAGVGIVAATFAVQQLTTAWIGYQNALAGGETATKLASDGLAKLEISMRQQGIDISDASAQYESGQISVEQYRQKLLALAIAYRDLNPYVESAAAAHDRLASQVATAAKKISDAQTEATEQLKIAAQVLADYKAKADGSAESLANIARAQNAYTAALKAADPTIKGAVQSLADIQTKAGEAALHVDQARAVYLQAVEAFKGGKATMDDVNAAWDQFAKAAKAAHEPITSIQHDMDTLKAKVGEQIGSLVNLRDEWTQLKTAGDKTAAGQLALAEALVNVESKAKALGLTVDVVGGQLEFGLSDKAGKASAGVQLLADELNQAYGPTQKLGVIINGTFVPTLQSVADKAGAASKALADATDVIKNVPPAVSAAGKAVSDLNFVLVQTDEGFKSVYTSASTTLNAIGSVSGNIRVLKGDTDAYNKSLADLSTTWVFINGQWERASDLLKTVQGAMMDTASSTNGLGDSLNYTKAQLSAISDVVVIFGGETMKVTDILRLYREGLISAAEANVALANAADKATASTDKLGASLSRAKSAGGGGKPDFGGWGNDLGSGSSGSMPLTAYLEDLISLASSPVATIGGNFSGFDLDNMINALQTALGTMPTYDFNTPLKDQRLNKGGGGGGDSSSPSTAVNAIVSKITADLGFSSDLIVKASESVAQSFEGITSAQQALVTSAGAAGDALSNVSGTAAMAAASLSTTASVASTAARASIQAMAASVAALTPATQAPGSKASMLPPISLTIQANGPIVGANGMQQLVGMVQQGLVSTLQTSVGQKLM